jgi:phosphoglycolate phosphatase-like HAD superfamily hydrolase
MAAHQIDFGDFGKIHNAFIANLECVLRENSDKRVLPGIKMLLQRVAENGGINALLTSNLKAGAECKLKTLGLLDDEAGKKRFMGGGYGDIAREKWEAAQSAFFEINQQTGRRYKTSHCVIIGDSLYDIETARRFGCSVIAVATGWTSPKDLATASPDALFTDLSDTETVFSKIRQITRQEI